MGCETGHPRRVGYYNIVYTTRDISSRLTCVHRSWKTLTEYNYCCIIRPGGGGGGGGVLQHHRRVAGFVRVIITSDIRTD